MTAPLPAPATHRPHLAEVVPLVVRTAPVVALATAADLVSASDKVLWVEYVTLGGSADLERFRGHLRRPDPAWPEHEVVLDTLEAVLADEGVPARVR